MSMDEQVPGNVQRGSRPVVVFIKDVTAGTCAGIMQLLVGHPFDTLKVKMQTATPGQYKGIVDCFRKTVATQGLIRGLYRGMSSPLGGAAFYNAILFSTNEYMKGLVANPGQDKKHLATWQYMAAGAGTGAVVSIVLAPIELLKCQLQAQQTIGESVAKDLKSTAPLRQFKGPLDLGAHIYKTRGITALFQGTVPTIIRESPGTMVYFAAYESVKNIIAKAKGISKEQLSPQDYMLSGGIGGVAFWALFYPVDTVKTKIQTDPADNRQYKGVLDAAMKLYRTVGLKGFYKGFVPCMCRAFPCNAAAFLVFEFTSKQLNKHWA